MREECLPDMVESWYHIIVSIFPSLKPSSYSARTPEKLLDKIIKKNDLGRIDLSRKSLVQNIIYRPIKGLPSERVARGVAWTTDDAIAAATVSNVKIWFRLLKPCLLFNIIKLIY